MMIRKYNTDRASAERMPDNGIINSARLVQYLLIQLKVANSHNLRGGSNVVSSDILIAQSSSRSGFHAEWEEGMRSRVADLLQFNN